MLLAVTYSDVVYFGIAVSFVFMGMIAYSIFEWWSAKKEVCPSPYTGHPLRKGSELPDRTAEKVLRYLYEMYEYDNRLFDLNKAAFCRETGRIFPNALTWSGNIDVGWDFLQKRHPGEYVSWGSLTEEQKTLVRERHLSLEGYQTDYSSFTPSPRLVENEYAHASPGPLYIDIRTGVLLGWKKVPGTELEVLIVQKPYEQYLPGITKL